MIFGSWHHCRFPSVSTWIFQSQNIIRSATLEFLRTDDDYCWHTWNPRLPFGPFSRFFNPFRRGILQHLSSCVGTVYLENGTYWDDCHIWHSVNQDLKNFHVGAKQFRSMLRPWDVDWQATRSYHQKARFFRLLLVLVAYLGELGITPKGIPYVLGDFTRQYCYHTRRGYL